MSFEAKVKELGYNIETVELNAGKIMGGVRVGDIIYTSGQVSRFGDQAIFGRLGKDVTVEQGYEAAKLATLSALAVIKTLAGGSLDNVERIVKVLGMVNVDSDNFNDTPNVIHGCSDLLLEVFGEAGRHARSAVGMRIPVDYAVEIEIIAQVKS
jgi:enamine deaminase RidA (YjgF/YER057c/UK114 family)